MDDGVWRRVRLVPFDQIIALEAVNPTLRTELRAELPGILAWAVRGCLDWQRQGLNPPRSVTDATKEYRNSENETLAFFDECTTQDLQLWCTASDLLSAITHWCKRNGIADIPSSRRLSDLLKGLGFVSVKRSGRRGWRGLDLTSEARAGTHEGGSR